MNVYLFLYSDAESGETKVELNKVSTSIPFYGVPDLAEVLGKFAFSDLATVPVLVSQLKPAAQRILCEILQRLFLWSIISALL